MMKRPTGMRAGVLILMSRAAQLTAQAAAERAEKQAPTVAARQGNTQETAAAEATAFEEV